MRPWLLAGIGAIVWASCVCAQEDKKTDDLKPAYPDTGESTVKEETLGLLPNPPGEEGHQVRHHLHW